MHFRAFMLVCYLFLMDINYQNAFNVRIIMNNLYGLNNEVTTFYTLVLTMIVLYNKYVYTGTTICALFSFNKIVRQINDFWYISHIL